MTNLAGHLKDFTEEIASVDWSPILKNDENPYTAFHHIFTEKIGASSECRPVLERK